MLPHALERVEEWSQAWRDSGTLVLLLDFDGTLAPIVDHPDLAAMPDATRAALARLMAMPGVRVAVVTGRGRADARTRAGIADIAYAGNHGMEIHGPGIDRVHPEAAAARPLLAEAARRLAEPVAAVPGAWVEDKELTLSVHFRQAPREALPQLTQAVALTVAMLPGLRMTSGKQVLEVRPGVDWDKGRAVLFLLHQMQPPQGAAVLYLGDDRTDEDAFRALAAWSPDAAGVLVGEPTGATAARAYLRTPEEVGALLAALATAGPAE